MDKNIAAFLRENVKTVNVRLPGMKEEDAGVTYITTIELAKGDVVIVDVRDKFVIAKVLEAHDDLQIRPNEDIEYKYVVQKLDFAAYDELRAVNKQLTDTLGQAYQSNIRKQFRDTLLANLPDGGKDVMKLLGK